MKIYISTMFTLLMIPLLFPQQAKGIDSLLSDYNLENSPGASLLIVKDREVLLQKNYGLANPEEKIPVTSETNFRLASVTKQFTAVSVLMLVERCELRLDDNL